MIAITTKIKFSPTIILIAALITFYPTKHSFGQPDCDIIGGTIESGEAKCGAYDPEKIENVTEATGTNCPLVVESCCESGDKPTQFVLTYNGESCADSDNNQGDLGSKWDCDGDANGNTYVYITTNDDFSGYVSINSSFTVTNGGSNLSNPIELTIYDTQGGNELQYIEIHTSCSAPIVTGDQFGSIVLLSAVFENSFECGVSSGVAYQWEKREGTSGNWINISGATGISYDPSTITTTIQYRRKASDCCGSNYSNIITKTVNLPPVVTASDDQVKCTDDEDLTISAIASGGTPGYTYSWDNGLGNGATKSVNPSATTIYTVTVTDTKGCQNSDQVIITVIPELTDGGIIGYDESNCGGFDPDEIISVTDPVGIACEFTPPNNNGPNCCADGDKPIEFVLFYNGASCADSDNNQGSLGGKWDCNGDANGDAYVYISTNDDFSGYVSINSTFTVTNGSSNLSNPIELNIYDEEGGTELQYIEIHTSCSSPIVVGDQFGSLILISSKFEDGYQCGNEFSGLDYQWEQKTEDGAWTTISGAVDPSYDPSFISESTCYRRLAFNCCDSVYSNEVCKTISLPDPGEIGYNEENCGPFDPELIVSIKDGEGECIDDNGGEDCCETGGDKPIRFVLRYNGQSCAQSNNNQGNIGGKWDCEGNAQGDSNVYIVVNDGQFSGYVAINTNFIVENDGDKLSNPVEITIYDQQNGTELQYIEIHTSCSSPIVPGDQFGSIILLSSEFENNYQCGTTETELEYQWQFKEVNGSWTNIPGATGTTYDPSLITITTQYRRIAINCCGSDTSNIVTKYVYDNPTVTLTKIDATCGNDNGSITAIATGGKEPYSYSWNCSSSTLSILNNLSGGTTCMVTVTDSNGCIATDEITVVGTDSSNTKTIDLTTCDPNNVGTVIDSFINTNGCDSIVTTITTLLDSYSDTTRTTTCIAGEEGTVVDTLTAANGCDSIVTTITTLLPPARNTIDKTTCVPGEEGTVIDTLPGQAANGCDSIITTITTLLDSYSDTTRTTTCIASEEGIVRDTLTATNGCDSIVTTITTLLPPARNTIDKTTCVPGEEGTVIDTLPSQAANGCDSIITTITTLLDSYSDTTRTTTCIASEEGIVRDTLTATNGCDSIVTTITTLLPPARNTIDKTTCVPGEEGTVIDTLPSQAANGCDSIITTITTLLDSYSDTTRTTTCIAGEEGIVRDTLTATNGCDSIVTTITTLLPPARNTIDKTTCVPGEEGTVIDTLPSQAANGCDSIITTITTLLDSYSDTTRTTTCIAGEEGIVRDTLTASNGCDSIITTITTLLPPSTNTVNKTTCVPSEEGTVVDTLPSQAANGCDSIVTTITTLSDSYSDTTRTTTCIAGEEGTVRDTLTASNGCDSIVTTITTLLPPARNTIDKTTCVPGEEGTVVDTLPGQAANGCDSIVTTITTLSDSYSDTTRTTTCIAGEEGTVRDTLTASNGCDSIITTITTLLPPSRNTINKTTCVPGEEGTVVDTLTGQAANGCDSIVTTITTLLDSYSDTTRTTTCIAGEEGTVRDTLTASNGCDSIITTITTLLPPSRNTINKTTCVPGEEGTVVDTLPGQAANGCDSIVTTITTLLDSYSDTTRTTTCIAGEEGTVRDTLTASNGCDSIITTITTLLPPSTNTVNKTTCVPGEEGTVVDTLAGQAANGCDSIVTTITTLSDSYSDTSRTTTCIEGEEGMVRDTFTATTGCDSIVTTITSLLPPSRNTINKTTCVPGEEGTVVDTLPGQAANGCDSIITTITTLLDSYSDTTRTTTCIAGEEGTVRDTLTASNGCDSIITTITTLLPASTNTVNKTTCVPGEEGTMVDTLTGQAANGCDSIITTITTLSDSYSDTTRTTTCIAGEEGTVRDTLTASNGCDSIITTITTLLPPSRNTINKTTCVPGEEGTVVDTLPGQAANGCDSIITTITTLSDSYSDTTRTTTCIAGEEGTVRDTLTASNGCDSIITTITTLLPPSRNTINKTTCVPGEEGTVVDTLPGQAANGCDSIVTTITTLSDSYSDTTRTTTCIAGEEGTVRDTLTASNGCDSIITTITTLLPPSTNTVNKTTCVPGEEGTVIDTLAGQAANGCDSIVTTITTLSDSYSDTTRTTTCIAGEEGTVRDTLTASNGCDSIITTITTLLPPSRNTINKTTCVPGEEGTVVDTLPGQAANGCDSIITTITTLLESYTADTTQATTCVAGEEGIVRDTLVAANGCDSIITTITTLLPPSFNTIIDSTCIPGQEGTVIDTLFGQSANGCDSIVTTITILFDTISFELPDTVVLQCDSLTETSEYCLPIKFIDFINYFELTIDGEPYFDLPFICDLDSIGGYDFTTVINSNPQTYGGGNYLLLNWYVNGVDLITTNFNYSNFQELADKMNALDPLGNWEVKDGDRITGGYPNTNFVYGALDILSPNIGAIAKVAYNFGISSNGTLIEDIEEGCHWLTITDTRYTECATDSVYVCVECNECESTSDTIYVTSCDPIQIGTIVDSFLTFDNCDSVVTTITTLLDSYSDTIRTTTCIADEEGIVRDTLTAANGCDSIVTTITTLLPPARNTITLTTCISGQEGTVVDTLTGQAANGCDSIITTITTLLDSYSDTIRTTTCIVGEEGVIRDTLTAANGCDSIVTTITTLLPTATNTITQTTCIPGQEGTVVDTLTGQAANGCDSIITTITTLLDSYADTLRKNTCVAGFEGVFIDTFTASNGCDSIITFIVSLLPPATNTILDSTCIPGQEGTVIDTLYGQAANGCDSIITTITTLFDTISFELPDTVVIQCDTLTETAEYCLPIKFIDFINYFELTIDGEPYFDFPFICDLDSVGGYDFTTVINSNPQTYGGGTYILMNWFVNGVDLVTTNFTYSTFQELANKMNSLDPLGDWTAVNGDRITGGYPNTNFNYGVLDIFSPVIGAAAQIAYNYGITSNGTLIEDLEVGCRWITVTDTRNPVCGTDSVYVCVECDECISTNNTVYATSCDIDQVGTVIDSFLIEGGCDSIVTTITTLLEGYDTLINLESCLVADTGTVVESFEASNGCDSTITTITTLVDSYNDTVFLYTCYPYPFDPIVVHLTASTGCDSTITSIIINIDTCNIVCETPENLYATDLTFTQATLGWDPVPNGYLYTVQGRLKYSLFGTTVTRVVYSNSFRTNHLFPFLTYEFRVQADCIEDEFIEWSDWSDWKEFTLNPFLNRNGNISGRNAFELKQVDLFDVDDILTSYPNPSYGDVNIKFNVDETIDAYIVITDISGREINTIPITLSSSEKPLISFDSYKDGLYFISFYKEGVKLATEKILLVR